RGQILYAGVGTDGVDVLRERAFEDHGRDVVARLRRGERDGGAETHAEQNDRLRVRWARGAELVEHLIQIVPLEKARGGLRATAFAMGAKVDREDVIAQRVPL